MARVRLVSFGIAAAWNMKQTPTHLIRWMKGKYPWVLITHFMEVAVQTQDITVIPGQNIAGVSHTLSGCSQI